MNPSAPMRARPSRRHVFLALLRRDARVARRELVWFLLRTLMQPVLFLIVFGYLLPKMGFVHGQYTSALLPGILAVSMALSALQSVTMPLVADLGYSREIEDRLLAPVPVSMLAIEKIVSGAAQGVLAAVVILPLARLIMGEIPGLSFAHLGEAVVVTTLGSTVFAALGLVLGTVISPQQIGLMFSIIVAPMLMFGCAYYPWAGLAAAPAFQYGVLVNPLVYIAEAMRAVLTPDLPHMSLWVATLAMVILIWLFSWIGVRNFVKRTAS